MSLGSNPMRWWIREHFASSHTSCKHKVSWYSCWDRRMDVADILSRDGGIWHGQAIWWLSKCWEKDFAVHYLPCPLLQTCAFPIIINIYNASCHYFIWPSQQSSGIKIVIPFASEETEARGPEVVQLGGSRTREWFGASHCRRSSPRCFLTVSWDHQRPTWSSTAPSVIVKTPAVRRSRGNHWNWWLRTVVLEKTLESPLDCREIKPVHPKGNQTWNIHWKDWCWSWSSNTWATWCEHLTHWKGPWCWERLRTGGEGGHRGWDGWMASSTQGQESEQTLGAYEEQGSLASYRPRGCKELDMT